MSLFRTYTPKLLYQLTLKMIGSIFVHSPKLNPNLTSYFRAVLDAHHWIKSDLNNIIRNRDPEQKDVTIENIHASLVTIEQMLFGEASEFEEYSWMLFVYTIYRGPTQYICELVQYRLDYVVRIVMNKLYDCSERA